MTSQMIAKDAYIMMNMSTYRPATVISENPILARMDAAEEGGNYERTQDGTRRTRHGMINGDKMMTQIATIDGDTLILFWNISGDGHLRRILVDGNTGRTWMDTKRDAVIPIGQNNKYFDAVTKIMEARAN